MQKTNVELAKEQGCTARQISKSRRTGKIRVMDGVEVVRKQFTAPAHHVDSRNYLVQQQEREKRERIAAAASAAAKAAADEAAQASLDAD